MQHKDSAYCVRIEGRFPVSYSKAGVSHFGCPRVDMKVENGVYCLALQEEGCPVLARLEQMIMDDNGKE